MTKDEAGSHSQRQHEDAEQASAYRRVALHANAAIQAADTIELLTEELATLVGGSDHPAVQATAAAVDAVHKYARECEDERVEAWRRLQDYRVGRDADHARPIGSTPRG